MQPTKHAAILLLLLCTALPNTGCVFPVQTSARTQLDLDAGRIEVELPAQFNEAWIIGDVTINGYGPFPFVLDTGAGATVIDQATAEASGLNTTGTAEVTDLAGITTEYPIARADEIRTGPLGFGPTSIVVTDDVERLFGHLGAVGLLGYPAFAGYTLDLDYPARIVRISTQRLSQNEPGAVPMRRIMNNTPEVRLAIASAGGVETPVWIGVDSGGEFFLDLAEHHAKVWLETDLSMVRGRSFTLSGKQGKERIAPLRGDLVVAGNRLEHTTATIGHEDSLIGNSLMRNFRVRIDPESRIATFTSPSKPTLSRPAWIGLGARSIIDGEIVVFSLYKETPAYQAGIRPGTTIIAIDGSPPHPGDLAYTWSRELPNEITLTVRASDGFTSDVTLQPTFLFPDIIENAAPLEIEQVPVLDVPEISAPKENPRL
ncbi:MAG: aspartyl protease family protein [Phycisphaeraceae bacterium]